MARFSNRIAFWGLGLSLFAAACADQQPQPLDPLDPPPPVPPVVDSLVLAPDTASVVVGDSVRFTVANLTLRGNPSSGAVQWAADGGVIDSSGQYRAAAEGVFEVRAQRTGLSGRARVRVQPADRLVALTLTPDSAALAPGGTQPFAAQARYASGQTSAASPTWSATGGTIDGNGRYIAGTSAGAFRVIASQGGLADTAGVRIASPAAQLTRVTLSPRTGTLQFGGILQFAVTAQWSDGSTAVPALAWTASGGTVDASGRFTAPRTAGSYRVIVRHAASGIADSVQVTVVAPTLLSLRVTPDSADVAAGATRQFAVTAAWSDGTAAVPTLAWSATGGTVSGAGLYTAGATPGVYRVIALQTGGSVADTATVRIPVALASCSVAPATLHLALGATQQFTVTGRLTDGTSASVAVVWSATGGTINTNGLFTAGNVSGSFRVIAAVAATSISCAADVTVDPAPAPVLAAVEVAPATVSLAAGATQQFTATGRNSDGSTRSVAVTWTASAGSISSAGLYTAATTTGTYRVIAVQQGGTLADTAQVTVTAAPPPTLTQLTLTPASITLAAGATQQFSVAGTWSNGSSAIPTVTYTGTGGTVSTGGLYTAGNIAGNYQVVASHVGGTLKDTSSVTITAGGGGGTTLFSEGFEDGNLGNRGWFDVTNVAVVSDARPGSSGSRVLQWHWTQGSTAPQGASRRDFGPSSSVYFSYWVKHSTNWVGSGRNYHPHLFQMITTADDHFIGPSITHLTVYDELLYLNGNITAQLAIQDALMINEANINVDLRGVTEQRSIGGYNGQHEFDDATSTVQWDLYLYSPGQHTNYRLIRPKAVTITNATKNAWHHIESYWQLNSVVSGIGQQDGVLQYWVDGVLTVDRHDVYYRTGANPNMRFSTLLLAPYIGDGSPADQFMWLDDLTIGTARP